MLRDIPARFVHLVVLTKMGKAICTLKIMPETVEVDLRGLEKQLKAKLATIQIEVVKVERENIAFGLMALKLIFLIDEDKGDTDKIESLCKEVPGVLNAEIVDMRRSF